MKKNQRRLLHGGLCLLLTAAMVFGVLSLRQSAPPREEETAPASRMLLSSSELLYDADSTSPVESAALGGSTVQTTETEAEPKQEPQQEEEPEQSAEQEQQQPESEPQPTEGETASAEEESAGDSDSGLDDLLEIGSSGGGSGGQTPVREASEVQGNTEVGDPDRYFETSIVDGDVVDYEKYTFTIRHLKPELTVLGLTVTQNEVDYDYRAGTTGVLLKLAEGANRIVVRAYYRDGTDTVTAAQSYTVYYGAGGEVMIVALRDSDSASLSEIGSTAAEQLDFTAYGLKDGAHLAASVRLNGKTLSGSGESFSAALVFGENTIEVTAGGRSDTVTEAYTIEYREDSFCITTSFDDTVIDNETEQAASGSEEVSLSLDSEEFRFCFYLNRETGKEEIRQVRYADTTLEAEGDGWYTATLDPRSPEYLTLRYTDSDGNARTFRWVLRFSRSEEATPEEKRPVINATLEVGSSIIGLEDGLVLKSPDVITILDSVSSEGEQLYLGNYRVWVNGQEVGSPVSQTGHAFGYETYLTEEGANTITVSATDPDGYSVEQSWTVYYEPGEITVTVSVEATTVGLGELIPPTEVTVPGGTDLLTIVEELLEENGYTASVSSSYLSAIEGEGICEGYSIDEELMELIIEDGMDPTGAGYEPAPASMDSLGEFDFYRWSGWMYSYNERYPGYSMAACKPQDGAEIRIRFTLALGKDIGAYTGEMGTYGGESGNYYKEW